MKKTVKRLFGVTACALVLSGCQNEAQSKEEVSVRGMSQQGEVVQETEFISLDDAKQIAFDHAGVDGNKADFDDEELDESDQKYELEFEVGEVEYEYDIHAVTGDILKVERDNTDEKTEKDEKSADLSLEEAINVALEHAGVDRNAVTFEEKDLDDDVFELEFFSENVEFDYDIHARTGKILEAEQESNERTRSEKQTVAKESKEVNKEKQPEQNKEKAQAPRAEKSKSTSPTSNYIGLEKAKDIALNHSGQSLSTVKFDDEELDKDDQLYELEFSSNGTEYEYDIHAVSGKIVSVEIEQEDVKNTRKTHKTEAASTQKQKSEDASRQKQANKKETAEKKPALLSKDQAIALALDHAGLGRDQVEFDDIERDEEDGRIIWEIDFDAGSYEYEYEIDAETGNILDHEKEFDD